MGAVRKGLPKLPKVSIQDPCTPASKHRFQLVQRGRFNEKIGQYTLLLRCFHCANSVYVITKAITIPKPRLPSRRKARADANLTNGGL